MKTVSPKVTAAAGAAAVGTIVVWLASLAGLDVPAGVETALVTLLTFAAGWLVRDPARSGRHLAADDAG